MDPNWNEIPVTEEEEQAMDDRLALEGVYWRPQRRGGLTFESPQQRPQPHKTTS